MPAIVLFFSAQILADVEQARLDAVAADLQARIDEGKLSGAVVMVVAQVVAVAVVVFRMCDVFVHVCLCVGVFVCGRDVGEVLGCCGRFQKLVSGHQLLEIKKLLV